jgi:hypothetical protein
MNPMVADPPWRADDKAIKDRSHNLAAHSVFDDPANGFEGGRNYPLASLQTPAPA